MTPPRFFIAFETPEQASVAALLVAVGATVAERRTKLYVPALVAAELLMTTSEGRRDVRVTAEIFAEMLKQVMPALRERSVSDPLDSSAG